MLSIDPKFGEYSLFSRVQGAQGTNFAPAERVSFGGGEVASVDGFSERHGNGKAAGQDSNGVIGSVTGLGPNGEFVLDRLYG